MRDIAFLLIASCMFVMTVVTASAEAVLAQHRGVTLGEPLEVVVAHLQMSAADVKVMHERPALVQQLTWRPRQAVSGSTAPADSVGEIVFTFHAGRLARIGVHYDRERTQGLTNADLQEALSGVYGESLLIGTPIYQWSSGPPERQTIGRWEDGTTLLILWREQFPNRVGLVISSIATDAALQQAITDGVRLDTAEGPARDLARATAEAAAVRARDEKIRSDNKSKFKPN